MDNRELQRNREEAVEQLNILFGMDIDVDKIPPIPDNMQSFNQGGSVSGSLGSPSSNLGMAIDKDFFAQKGLDVEFDNNSEMITPAVQQTINNYICT